jgi:hypothetical protein
LHFDLRSSIYKLNHEKEKGDDSKTINFSIGTGFFVTEHAYHNTFGYFPSAFELILYFILIVANQSRKFSQQSLIY